MFFFLKIQLIFVPIAVIGLVLITVGGATVHVAFFFNIMLLDCF